MRKFALQVLSLMLEQSGMHLGSFPETPFRLKDWTVRGSHCVLDKAPDRMLDIQVCSHAFHTCCILGDSVLCAPSSAAGAMALHDTEARRPVQHFGLAPV